MSEKLINSITNLKICEKSFKIVVSELSECNKLPETVKEILNTAVRLICIHLNCIILFDPSDHF